VTVALNTFVTFATMNNNVLNVNVQCVKTVITKIRNVLIVNKMPRFIPFIEKGDCKCTEDRLVWRDVCLSCERIIKEEDRELQERPTDVTSVD